MLHQYALKRRASAIDIVDNQPAANVHQTLLQGRVRTHLRRCETSYYYDARGHAAVIVGELRVPNQREVSHYSLNVSRPTHNIFVGAMPPISRSALWNIWYRSLVCDQHDVSSQKLLHTDVSLLNAYYFYFTYTT